MIKNYVILGTLKNQQFKQLINEKNYTFFSTN